MEMPAAKIGAKVYQQAGGMNYPTPQKADQIRELIKNNIFIFNTYGSAKAPRILEVFEYARRRYGVEYFVIDSLAKCGFAEDDHSGQKALVDQLADFALEKRVHVCLVVHMRKGDTEEKPPGKFDVKGTGAITDMVSSVFIIHRNKRKERLLREGGINDTPELLREPDTKLICVKQRETGEEPIFALWFHPQSCQFLESKHSEPKLYIR
jgi:twinkle protein